MKKWFYQNKLPLLGIMLGAIAGFLYWQQVGCISGTCAITSRPINSTVYGAIIGFFVFGLFKKENSNNAVKKENDGHDI